MTFFRDLNLLPINLLVTTNVRDQDSSIRQQLVRGEKYSRLRGSREICQKVELKRVYIACLNVTVKAFRKTIKTTYIKKCE